MTQNFLKSTRLQFEYYQSLGKKPFSQLEEKDLFWQPSPESNSIAIIVNHLHGNMMSRWTNFLTEDGEKSWRKRDEEFEDIIQSKEELLQKWNEGWNYLFQAIDSVNEENFGQLVYIRNQGHTFVEALLRQLAHYAYHVGEIVYLGRLIKGAEWQSLSIPKGKSKEFNAKKFSQEKHQEHFTKEFLDKK
jgi:hypothetical protein